MRKLAIGLSAFIAFLIGFCVIQQPAEGCLETRGAFDIGSGTTRLQVAEVDICRNKIVKEISRNHAKVEFRSDLAGKEKKFFSERVQLQGINAIKDLLEASEVEVVSYSGVATEAFRQAENGVQVLRLLAEKIGDVTGKGARLEIISQTQEAQLGVVGAASRIGSFLSRTAVWDIGGGSMQISVPDEGGELMIFESKFGAQQMKESIIQQVKREDTDTPNPISQDQYLTSKGLAIMAAGEIPEPIRSRLSNPSLRVIGIGGVHEFSIKGQTRTDGTYTVRDVRQAILKRLDLTDEELGGEYAKTDLSNLILVDGFMEHLDLDSIHTLNVDMTDGVLVSPSYWE